VVTGQQQQQQQQQQQCHRERFSARGLCGSCRPPPYGLGRVKGVRQCARVNGTHISHHTLPGRTLFFSHGRVTRRLRCGPGRIAIDYRDFAASSQ